MIDLAKPPENFFFFLCAMAENFSQCIAYSEFSPDLTNLLAVKVIFFAIYGIYFVLGAFGNASVVYTTLRNPALQTVQNYFILNLAVADCK